MIEEREHHLVVAESDVVLHDFDEDVSSAVVAVPERGFVVMSARRW